MMGKTFKQYGDSEATDYNHKACKSSAGRVNKVDNEATDYSIKSKKMTPKYRGE